MTTGACGPPTPVPEDKTPRQPRECSLAFHRKRAWKGCFIAKHRGGRLLGVSRVLLATTLILTGLLVDSSAGRQGEQHAALIFKGRFGSDEPSEGGLSSPYDVAVDPTTGDIFVVDSATMRIHKYDKNGQFLMAFGTPGTGASHDADGTLYIPNAIAIDPSGAFLYVADTFNSRIQVFNTAEGGFHRKWGPQFQIGVNDKGEPIHDQLDHPNGIAIDAEGNVYVADTRKHRVVKFTSTGTFIKKWGTFANTDGNFVTPVGIEVANGAVFVVEDAGRFQEFSLDGAFIRGYGVGHLSNPDEIAVDEGGFAYVIESGGEGDGHEVSVFSLLPTDETPFEGEFKGTFDPGSDYGFGPHGIFYDPKTTDLFVAAGGAEGKKIFRYKTRGKPFIQVDFPANIHKGNKLFFILSHNMMLGSCFVRGSGVLKTPQGHPFYEGETFDVRGSRMGVKPKEEARYAIPISDRASNAIERTGVLVDVKFTATDDCDTLYGNDTPDPVRERFTL